MEFLKACPDINFVDGGFACGKVPSFSEKSSINLNCFCRICWIVFGSIIYNIEWERKIPKTKDFF